MNLNLFTLLLQVVDGGYADAGHGHGHGHGDAGHGSAQVVKVRQSTNNGYFVLPLSSIDKKHKLYAKIINIDR